MGIRFYCPNGHKLNVKEFQAGRKGICPYCGVKILIPTESTRPSSKFAHRRHVSDDESESEPSQPDDASGEILPAVVVASNVASSTPATSEAAASDAFAAGASVPIAKAAEPLRGFSPSGAEPVAGGGLSGAASPSAPVDAGPTPPGSAPVDPLAEAGNVVWYVRPASGGQFGPAGADVMRSWLAEGRIAADSLVWHEGWRDWQEASSVFPQLGAGRNDFLIGNIFPAGGASVGQVRSSRPASRPRSSGLQALVIVLLVVAMIVLIGIFAVIISHMS